MRVGAALASAHNPRAPIQPSRQFAFRPGLGDVAGCTHPWIGSQIRQTLVWAAITVGFHTLMYFWRQPYSVVGKAYGEPARGGCVCVWGGGASFLAGA